MMSDVTVAPNASPPPAAPSREVPIDPNPVSTPQPVGSQAPDKPVSDLKGSEHRPLSRRETIQAAFEKSRAERAKPEPAKARMGHNQPPEPMEKEPPKAQAKEKAPRPEEGLDLRKRPTDQPREQGRFAPREPDKRAGQQDPNLRTNNQQHPQLPEGTPYREAPPRMTERAKAEWAKTPESVRADVHRMHHEFGRAYQAYRADHEAMNAIRPFHQMAREHGTTLDKALTNYVSMEQKLRSDVIGGLDLIVNNLNLRADDGTPQGRKLSLQDVAWHIVNQTPEQHQLLQSKNKMMAQSHQLAEANQRIAALENRQHQMQYADHFKHLRSGVDQYAATHPRLDELADLIVNEVKLGFDLDTAYRRAELLRPASHAAQTRTNGTAAQTRSTTAQTRTSDRSIHGAPESEPSGARRRPDKPVGRREAIANAIRRVNGGL